MRRKRRIGILFIVTSLILMLLPVPEADAATSASDFVIDRETLLQYKGKEKKVTVPSSVEIIGEGAFQENTTVQEITLPDSVQKIEAYAFWGCDNLKTVILGKGLSEIGDLAFNNCTGLESIVLPANVHRIGIQSFAYCQRLADITIPPEVTEIREDAFDGDYLLNIRCETGSYADKYAKAFYEKQKEMSVYGLPDSGSTADASDVSGDTVTPNEDVSAAPSYEVQGDVLGSTHVVGNQAVVLMQNSNLNVLGQASVESVIGKVQTDINGMKPDIGSAQINADGTQDNTASDADLGAAFGGFGDLAGLIRSVPERAFYRNETLGEVEVGEDVREIGAFAYARSSLSAITLPEGLEKIDYASFYHCDNLTSVELPDTLTEVAAKAFNYTPWLENFMSASPEEGMFLISGGVLVAYRGSEEELTVPEGVRVIAAEAFADHPELKRVRLPESLQVVGDRAFVNCSLEAVDYSGSALGEELLEEQIRLSDNSAAPVRESGFHWLKGLGGVLLLVGVIFEFSNFFSCILRRFQI